MAEIRIRKCKGNKDCWAAVLGPNEWLMATAYSLDTLLKILDERTRNQVMQITLVA